MSLTPSRPRRLALRSLGLAILATAALALPGPADIVGSPAGAATTALTLQGTLNHTLSGV